MSALFYINISYVRFLSFIVLPKLSSPSSTVLNFINLRNKPHHKKEHVNISDAAKFQSCRPNNTRNGRHLKNPKIRDRYGSHVGDCGFN